MTEADIIAANVANGWRRADDPPEMDGRYPVLVAEPPDFFGEINLGMDSWCDGQWMKRRGLAARDRVILWYPIPAPVRE